MDAADDRLAERLALIASPGALESVGSSVEDLADPDVRQVVVRADHPELDRALQEGRSEITVAGESMSARLHLAMHELLAHQLVDNDPPEVFQTAQRLLAAGYDRHEVLHMLCASISAEIFGALKQGESYDRQRHLDALRGLPESWERQRAQRTLTRQDPHGRHTTRRRRG